MDQSSPEVPVEKVPVAPKTTKSSSSHDYSLKEKYFQVEPEGRIRRYQYFVRSLVPGILLFLLFLVGGIFALPLLVMLGKFSLILWLVVWGYLYWVFFNLAKVNSIKRSRDFGSDGKIAVYIVTASFIMGVVWLLVWALQGFGILPTADYSAAISSMSAVSWEDPLMALRQMSDAMKVATPMYERLLGYVGNIVSIASVIMWLILLFRPGVSWDNQYGKDSAKNTVSFLG